MKLTNVNVAMRDACFAAARQGFAFDVAWCDEFRDRQCRIPSGPIERVPLRGVAGPATGRSPWRNRFAKGPAPVSRFASDTAVQAQQLLATFANDTDTSTEKANMVDDDTITELTLYLGSILDADQMLRVAGILGFDTESGATMASDSMYRRVRQAEMRNRGLAGTRLAARFPNHNRLG